jgi:hypothetical protein
MPNHFHILIKQLSKLPVSEMIRKLNTSYVKYFNARYKRVGNLFQDTFKAKHVADDGYLAYLTAYIHNNPLEPFNYPYSSLPEYLGWRSGNLCVPEFILGHFQSDREQYKKFVQNYNLKVHEKIQHLAFDED